MSILRKEDINGVTILTINRPEARNALNVEAQRAFADAVEELHQNPPVALILTGAGDKAFIAGGDLNELAADPSPETGRRLHTLMKDALVRLTQLPCPVIGAVNGHAAGGGVEVLSACDLRIAVPTAKFHFVQVKMGLTSGWGGGPRLVKLLGQSCVMNLMLNGASISAAEAQRIGFIHRIAQPNQTTREAALSWVQELSQLPADSLAAIKSLVNFSAGNSLEQGYAKETETFLPLFGGPSNLEALNAFKEKRKPKFNR
ncbi:MAG: enoyl-CoA hydratase [Cellvibrionaceae bacterium]|jgi:enoyl-CoA hydratase